MLLKIIFEISLSHEYFKDGTWSRYIHALQKFCEIENLKADEKRRRLDRREFAKLSSSLRRQRESHMLAIVSLLNTRWPSRRDCFALISRLNIQSLHHGGLAQAIISQTDKSKWYLCPRAISRRDNIFTSFFAFYSAPLDNGTYFEARRLADNSRWKRWTEHLFWSAVLFAPFLCCFGGSVSLRIPMHQFHLVRNILFHLISRDYEVDYLKTDVSFIPRDFYYLQ